MADDVGQRLLALRQMAGWSREQLARRVNDRAGLGWYQSTVQKNETGGRRLTLDDLNALVDVFDRSGIDDLLHDADPEVVEVDGVGLVSLPTPDERMTEEVDAARIAVLRRERDFQRDQIAARQRESDFHRDRIAAIEVELDRLCEPPGGWDALQTEGEGD